MDTSTVLPPIGQPVSTALLNLDELDNASFGEVVHAMTLLGNIAATRIADPRTYHEIATFQDPSDMDWSGYQPADEAADAGATNTESEAPTSGHEVLPTPPENYCDSLPAIGRMLSHMERFQHVLGLNFARYVESSIGAQDLYFGTPYQKSLFKDSARYLSETMKISRKQAAKLIQHGQYYGYQPGADPELASAQPTFPKVARALASGDVPVENADRIITLDQDLTKYSTKVGQPLARKDAALSAFEPTMAQAAETATPDELTKAKQRWLAQLAHWVCEDGPSPSAALKKPADNALRTREHGDGSTTFSVHATPDVSALFKNFALQQLKFNGTPVKIPDAIMRLFGPADQSADPFAEPASAATPQPTPHPEKPDDLGEPGKLDAGEQPSDKRHPTEESADGPQTLVDALGPIELWDTSPEPDEVVALDEHNRPVTAAELGLYEQLTTGQRIMAILMGMFHTITTMDPADLGAKKAYGSGVQLTIVQDIETAYHTLGVGKIPEAARRPQSPDGISSDIFKVANPTDLKSPGASDPPAAPDDAQTRAEREARKPWTSYQSETVNIGPMHPNDAELLACDSELVAQIWDGPDTVLAQKRKFRLFQPAQRRAIFARDKGCQAPGCTIAAVYAHIHHIVEWLQGGTTDETNAITLCATHHAAIHNGKWTITKYDGRTFFQPAPWLDGSQPLLRNIYWNS